MNIQSFFNFSVLCPVTDSYFDDHLKKKNPDDQGPRFIFAVSDNWRETWDWGAVWEP